MKTRYLLAAMFPVLVTTTAYARNDLGVGIIVGEPTGVSVKKWVDSRHAVDAAVAWSFSDNESFQFQADYLIHNYDLFRQPGVRGQLPFYFGIGGRFKLRNSDGGGRNNDHDLAGIRIPFGVSYLFPHAPFDVFGEVVPILDVAPGTHFTIDAAVGARFYFH